MSEQVVDIKKMCPMLGQIPIALIEYLYNNGIPDLENGKQLFTSFREQIISANDNTPYKVHLELSILKGEAPVL